MTFDKYKNGREKFNDTVFPDDGYEYDYVFDKKIGWHVVRIRKLPEFIEGNIWKNDFDIDKEIVKRKFKAIKKWIFNKIDGKGFLIGILRFQRKLMNY